MILKKIFSRVYNSQYLLFIRLKLDREIILSSKIWGGGIFRQDIDNCFKLFMSQDEHKDKKLLSRTEYDIIKSYYKYGITPQEYFLFDFRNCSHSRRTKFLTNQHKDRVMISKVGMGVNCDLLENKGIFYENFKSYFYRDICVLDSKYKLDEFRVFCEKHNTFIAKPFDGQCGKGIEIINIENIETEFYRLTSSGKWILEELIVQDEKLAVFNSTSVNTVRIPSFINKSGFQILKPFFRMGRHGFVIDNAGAGGVFSIIDEKTGELLTDGIDEYGVSFEKHPDSNIPIKGYVIPRWSELLSLAETIHRTIAYYPYVGWDFALTNDGWVLIEGNWGQFISEFADKEGIKVRFDNMFE